MEGPWQSPVTPTAETGPGPGAGRRYVWGGAAKRKWALARPSGVLADGS